MRFAIISTSVPVHRLAVRLPHIALPMSVTHVIIVRTVAQVGRRQWETNAVLGH